MCTGHAFFWGGKFPLIVCPAIPILLCQALALVAVEPTGCVNQSSIMRVAWLFLFLLFFSGQTDGFQASFFLVQPIYNGLLAQLARIFCLTRSGGAVARAIGSVGEAAGFLPINPAGGAHHPRISWSLHAALVATHAGSGFDNWGTDTLTNYPPGVVQDTLKVRQAPLH
jgi:hypothetical protein